MLLCLLLPVRLPLDANDFGVMDQPVNECHDAGRVGEHFVPVSKRFIGCQQRAFLLVAAADQLEQQVGITAGIREVPNLINGQQ